MLFLRACQLKHLIAVTVNWKRMSAWEIFKKDLASHFLNESSSSALHYIRTIVIGLILLCISIIVRYRIL